VNTPSRQIGILIVDDDKDDFFIISEYIKEIPGQSFAINWSFQYNDALKHMRESNYDLYLVDYRLGIRTGLDLLNEAKLFQLEEPTIILTGKGNHKIDMEAMNAGAIDYLVKSDLTTEKLERSIRYALERSASIKALKRNEKKFRNIFERSKDPVFLTDQNLVFKETNQALSDLLIYSTDELYQVSLYDLLPDRKNQSLIKAALSEKKELNDMEIELLTKNKETLSCVVSILPIVDENGKTYIQGIIHDITNIKKAERATFLLEQLNSTGRLMQTLAHEVRNPLNNINLSVDMLVEENNHDQGKTYLDIIARNSKRIGDLITELLNSSRPAEIEKKKICLQDVVDQTITAAHDRLILKQIKISASYNNKPAFIIGDIEKLKFALLNIVVNAIEAITHEHGNIHISIQENVEDYIVKVSDNGIGMSQENMLRLFEPYFTLKKNGLGLGLSSSFKILQSHNGRIDVKTALGEGTAFIIKFSKKLET
jgi:PAS domain S-box-containing protein